MLKRPFSVMIFPCKDLAQPVDLTLNAKSTLIETMHAVALEKFLGLLWCRFLGCPQDVGITQGLLRCGFCLGGGNSLKFLAKTPSPSQTKGSA